MALYQNKTQGGTQRCMQEEKISY